MRFLITGASGLVGSRFLELSKYKNNFLIPDLIELNLVDSNSVKAFISSNKPNIIINFAAYTNVGEAEKQRNDYDGDSWKVNVAAVENILDSIDHETKFIQISTDYVFPGSSDNPGPYSEDQLPETDSAKLTWYGFTKAEAERTVNAKLGNRATILRLIYPVCAQYDQKLDYLRKPLKLFDEGKLYPMFTDQQVSISFIDEICVALDKIIESGKTGIFHSGSSNTTSPYQLISYLLEKARGGKNVVQKSSLDDFLKTVDNPVRYPKFGGLKVEKTERELGIKFSSTTEIIDKLVEQGISAI